MMSKSKPPIWLFIFLLCFGLLLLVWGAWIPLKAQLAQHLLEDAFDKSQKTNSTHKAWTWADTWPVARLTIPSLSLDAIILKEAGGEGLAFGPVHLDQSAPLGHEGTSIISAHRDTHFKALAKLETGDIIHLETTDGHQLAYHVDTIRIAPWNQSGLSKHSLSRRLVLTSCWPFDAITPGPMRFIAEASLVVDAPIDLTQK